MAASRCRPSILGVSRVSNKTAGPETRGDEPLVRELPRILHLGDPLSGVPGARWSFHGHMGGVSIWFPGPPLGPWKFSMEPAMTKVSFVASVHVAVGAERCLGTFSWVAALSWPVRASFGSGELRSLGRSWALRRRGGEKSGQVPFQARNASPSAVAFSCSLAGAGRAGAFRFCLPLRQNRNERGASWPFGCSAFRFSGQDGKFPSDSDPPSRVGKAGMTRCGVPFPVGSSIYAGAGFDLGSYLRAESPTFFLKKGLLALSKSAPRSDPRRRHPLSGARNGPRPFPAGGR